MASAPFHPQVSESLRRIFRCSRVGLSIVCIISNFCFAPSAYAQDPADVLMQSARELFIAGDFESSEGALRLAISKIDNSSLRYAVCLQNLALLEYLNFNFSEAQKLYENAIALTEAACGRDSLPVANNLYGLSRCLRRTKQNEEAERCLSRLLELRIKLLGSEHRLVSNTYLDLAVNFDRQGKFDQAKPVYAKALEIREKESGKTSLNLKFVLESYAQCLRRLQENDKANELDTRVRGLTNTSNTSLPSTFTGGEDGSNWQTTIYSK